MGVQSANSITRGNSERARVLLDQWLTVRDGRRLHYIVYLPRDAREPVPAVIELTPYCFDRRHGDGVYFASRGFAFVLADVRGRGDSEGEFSPMKTDAEDGYDLVQWIASQPWCSGRIGLYGSSYTGANQWAIAARRPPALATIVPSAAGHFGVDVPAGGVPTSYYFRWRASTAGRQQYFNLFSDSALWHAEFAATLQEHGRLEAVAERIGLDDPDVEKHFRTPQLGAHWIGMFPTPEQLREMDIPVLCVGGQYDGSQLGHFRLYRELDKHGTPRAREKLYMLMGPWDHSGIMQGNSRVSDLRFEPQAGIDTRALKADWYDWTLRGAARPAFLDARVKYYMTGRECWLQARSLAEITAARHTLMLASNGVASDVFHSGWLLQESSAAAAAPMDTFKVDPRDVRAAEIERRPRDLDVPVGPGVGGGNYWAPWNDLFLALIGEAPTNQAFAVHLCGQGLVYHSAALDDDLELAGFPTTDLFLSSDVPDIDLMVFLYEIQADGTSIFLSSQLQRLQGLAADPRLVRFDEMRFFARRLARNSRLRCLVRSPSSLSFERTAPAGGSVSAAGPATISIHHDKNHPSAVHLPLARTSLSDKS